MEERQKEIQVKVEPGTGKTVARLEPGVPRVTGLGVEHMEIIREVAFRTRLTPDDFFFMLDNLPSYTKLINQFNYIEKNKIPLEVVKKQIGEAFKVPINSKHIDELTKWKDQLKTYLARADLADETVDDVLEAENELREVEKELKRAFKGNDDTDIDGNTVFKEDTREQELRQKALQDILTLSGEDSAETAEIRDELRELDAEIKNEYLYDDFLVSDDCDPNAEPVNLKKRKIDDTPRDNAKKNKYVNMDKEYTELEQAEILYKYKKAKKAMEKYEMQMEHFQKRKPKKKKILKGVFLVQGGKHNAIQID